MGITTRKKLFKFLSN